MDRTCGYHVEIALCALLRRGEVQLEHLERQYHRQLLSAHASYQPLRSAEQIPRRLPRQLQLARHHPHRGAVSHGLIGTVFIFFIDKSMFATSLNPEFLVASGHKKTPGITVQRKIYVSILSQEFENERNLLPTGIKKNYQSEAASCLYSPILINSP